MIQKEWKVKFTIFLQQNLLELITISEVDEQVEDLSHPVDRGNNIDLNLNKFYLKYNHRKLERFIGRSNGNGQTETRKKI